MCYRNIALKSGRLRDMATVKYSGWLGAAAAIAVVLLLPAPALAVTDADRLAVYKEFRTHFDARQYEAARPLAEKLVQLTEEQYGPEELPLATPVLMAGLRVATVTTIGLVAVTALIGQGGLGFVIITLGIRRSFETAILVGVALSVLLAVLADRGLVLLERALTPWAQGR